MDEELQQIVDRMIAAGESDEDIGLVIQGWQPTQPPAVDRFKGAFLDTINPMNAIRALPALIPGTHANQEATYARLKSQETNPVASALSNSPLGQFGGVNAGIRIASGDVAGGLGEGTAEVMRAGLPLAKGVPGATLRGANKAAVAGSEFVANNPAVGIALGAGIGYTQGGLGGALMGASGGSVAGAIPRLIRALEKNKTSAAPATPSTPAIVNTPLPPATPGLSVGTESQKLLTTGARPMPPGPDPSYVKSIPGKYGEPMNLDIIDVPAVAPIASHTPSPGIVQSAPPSAPLNLPNFSKADIARITALDKELGAANAARALRHDPRFASMSAAQRTEMVRAVTKGSAPGELPAVAAAEIDAKFADINPLMRAQYVESWRNVNPAVYRYLQQKLIK